MKGLLNISKDKNTTQLLLSSFCVIIILSLLVGIITELYVLAVLPLALLVIYLGIVDFKKLFFLMLFLIPFSTEVDLPNGFTIDVPDEPLMMGLTGLFLLYILKPSRSLKLDSLKHPITLFLIFHLLWIFITAMNAEIKVISFKFFLAKMWYVIPFYFLTLAMLKDEKDWKSYFWLLFIAICITVSYVMIRHGLKAFSFSSINKMVRPFYRNHVNYACLLTLFLPFIWFARHWFTRFSKNWWWIVLGGGLLFLGVFFSYTRAAYVALAMTFGAYWVIRWRLVRPVLLGILVVAFLGIFWMLQDNKHLDYAPDYSKTITHESFGNLISATSKGQDISTMERVYRWVAGYYMLQERPLMGFGPGNFAKKYKGYSVSFFSTYVSRNEEGSGIHNYYYMTTIEQGIIGGLIFVGLCFFVLIIGERIYHQSKDVFRRNFVMSVLLSFIVMLALLLINDMVEADKLGPFFFLSMALLVNLDLANRKALKEKNPS